MSWLCGGKADDGEEGAAVVVEPSAGVVQLQLTVWEQHR